MPTDDFIKLILSAGDIYKGRFMQSIIDKFRPIVKKSISQYLNELVNDKIKNALNSEETNMPQSEVVDKPVEAEETDGIVTTEDELQAYYVVKSVLGETIDLSRITYKDTVTYFSILLDDKVTRWGCRIYFKEKVKYIIIPTDNENIKYSVESVNDI